MNHQTHMARQMLTLREQHRQTITGQRRNRRFQNEPQGVGAQNG